MLIAITLAVVVCGGSLAQAGGSENEKTLAQAKAEKQKCPDVVRGIEYFKQSTWRWQKLRGVPTTKASKRQIAAHACDYARSVAKLWKERSWNARVKYEKWVASRTLPAINDWLTAIRYVQRIYPGTYDWMKYISDREGGHGVWVWYGGRTWSGYHVGNDFLGADTVGGCMQFRYSTFAPYWEHAKADLKRRGFIIPNFKMPAPGGDSQYAAWLSPMGQALTAGYMKWSGREGCHWCL